MDQKSSNESSVAQKIDAAVELAQLSERAVFALCAKPSPEARFTTLFGGKDAPLVRLFNETRILRRAGFSLEHDGNSRIVMGDLRRVLIPGWKIMELWRDGLLIYAVDALVQPFWGSPRPDGSVQLNPLALAEPIFLFAELSRLVYQESVRKPEHVEYHVRLDRLDRTGNEVSLCEGPLQPSFFADGRRHYAPASRMERSVIWEHGEIRAGAVAYQLIQETYHWFGISDDGIPYTRTEEDGIVVVDAEALKEAGKS